MDLASEVILRGSELVLSLGCEGIKREPKLREWPTNDLPNWRPMPWTKANP